MSTSQACSIGIWLNADSMGVLQQKASLEDFVQAVRRTVTASKAPKVRKLQRDSDY